MPMMITCSMKIFMKKIHRILQNFRDLLLCHVRQIPRAGVSLETVTTHLRLSHPLTCDCHVSLGWGGVGQ